MKLIGTVFRVQGTPWDYHNNVRPTVKGVAGLSICEVVLSEPADMITLLPQPAELHFSRIVQLDDAVAELDLYDGAKLIMKFQSMILADLEAGA